MKKIFVMPISIFLLIVATFTYYYCALSHNWWPTLGLSWAERGLLGDSFGVLTSLFTALAFGGLLLTLWYQSKSLEEAKNDADRQHFENILFRMLEIHNGIIRDIDLHHLLGDKSRRLLASGRDCFLIYYTDHLTRDFDEEKSASGNVGKEVALGAYEQFWCAQRHNLGHYFRYLYNIFKFINQAKLSKEDKRKYSNIVRAQLSDYELLILFYNCISKNGEERFKPLIEEYAIFNNLPTELLLDSSHVAFYESLAFGTN